MGASTGVGARGAEIAETVCVDFPCGEWEVLRDANGRVLRLLLTLEGTVSVVTTVGLADYSTAHEPHIVRGDS